MIVPWWAWVLAIQFLAFAYLFHTGYWSTKHPVKCPPHQWNEDETHQLICSECHKPPAELRFKHYDGII